ncbi:Hypothetical protein R9X50_00406100 [Acrodontium crateriforme]|uniref:Protein kinase domain-containing protein n=1 Tax=Acrodontium crateriforme TaxID=150365 RepID=A0AAQ3M4M7_9PEZI|nr:Hypothetical protein R9X50_00406100 [Acrodontium crateriforme]
MEPAASSTLEKALKRHSRPQFPTVPPRALQLPRSSLIQSSPSWIPPVPRPPAKARLASAVRSRRIARHVDWEDFTRLGALTQAQCSQLICQPKHGSPSLFMFKKLHTDTAFKHIFDMQHPCIVMAHHLIRSPDVQYVGFEYYRFTLEEVISIHLSMQEAHLYPIAKAIFSALQFLHEHGLVHGHVSTHSIRLCGRTGKVLLGDCEKSQSESSDDHNIDLDQLGLSILKCMEAQPQSSRTADEVRSERATNKVFGLSDAERWSDAKQLIDFLEDLFSLQRSRTLKLERPHDYINANIANDEILLPLIELASLECFTMWQTE